MTDKMREEFESMMSSQGEWPQAIEKSTDGGYRLKAAATAWETWQDAWQASRASLVVHLPAKDPSAYGAPDSGCGRPSMEQYEASAYNGAIDECRFAIEAAGIKVSIGGEVA